MQWTPGGTSSDIDDERGNSGGGGFGGGGGLGGVHLGVGGMIVVGILSLLFHQNLFSVFSGDGSAPSAQTGSRSMSDSPSGAPVASEPQEQSEVQFVSFILDDVQKNWDTVLPQTANVRYHHAKLVLFRNSFESACGMAQTAVGPFYCPEDEKVYLDLGFFDELKQRFGAPGQFAQAYVVAHEIGHHVQKIFGIEPKVRRLEQQNPQSANRYSVALELQADCFAGVWGHSTEQRKLIDESDIAQGLAAAAAVGDDRLQKMATGRVSPESFTHGSSAQRTTWFKRGLDSGSVDNCNTFTSAGN